MIKDNASSLMSRCGKAAGRVKVMFRRKEHTSFRKECSVYDFPYEGKVYLYNDEIKPLCMFLLRPLHTCTD